MPKLSRKDLIAEPYRAPWFGTSHRKGCASKRRYRDHEQAVSATRHWPGLRIYECAFCGGYHVSKQPDILAVALQLGSEGA